MVADYTVTAERGSSLPVWVFQCVEVPAAFSQGHHLEDVFTGALPEIIADIEGVPEESVQIRLIADSPSAQPA